MSTKNGKEVKGQITISEYIQNRLQTLWGGCTGCVCRNCLYWQSQRCPYGECWDDHRAVTDPYDKAHPEKPLRKGWSNWDRQGEQAHWCRGGQNYPVYYCPNFVKYRGQQVKTCLKANVVIFQDGYVDCCLIDSFGCERCYKEFLEKREEK